MKVLDRLKMELSNQAYLDNQSSLGFANLF
jgi:hypothetical protein